MSIDERRIENAKGRLKNKFSEYGIWEVKGEDTNPDYGGTHYQEVLGYFEGKLEHVFYYAINLPGFFCWGSGGDFKLIKITKITDRDSKEFINLIVRRDKLRKEIDILKDKINLLK